MSADDDNAADGTGVADNDGAFTDAGPADEDCTTEDDGTDDSVVVALVVAFFFAYGLSWTLSAIRFLLS